MPGKARPYIVGAGLAPALAAALVAASFLALAAALVANSQFLLEPRRPQNTVAQSTQVCYTHLARGVSSRNRLLCAFVRSNCGIEVQSITTYTASLLCAPCFALKQTDLQNLIVLCPVGREKQKEES